MGRYTELHIYDFGPFKEAHVELAPLTIFIGKNSLGKSMLLYLIWVLESALPEPRKHYEVIESMGGIKIAEECFDVMRKSGNPDELIRKLLMIFLKAFPAAWAKSLKDTLSAAFGVKTSELIRKGMQNSKLIIECERGSMEIVIEGDDVTARWVHLDEDLIKKAVVKTLGTSLYITIEGKEAISYVLSPLEVLDDLYVAFGNALYAIFKGIAGVSEAEERLLVDGRAGVERVLLPPYPGIPLGLREILMPDYVFVSSIPRLAEDYVRGDVDLEAPALRLLLEELGFKPVIRKEFGIPRIFIESWAGLTVPLERAPSGIRETMPAILALLSKNTSMVYIEEPEAHLHPRAIRLVPRLTAYAINRLGKQVRITTHSDILVSQVNNLIAHVGRPGGNPRAGLRALGTPEARAGARLLA